MKMKKTDFRKILSILKNAVDVYEEQYGYHNIVVSDGKLTAYNGYVMIEYEGGGVTGQFSVPFKKMSTFSSGSGYIELENGRLNDGEIELGGTSQDFAGTEIMYGEYIGDVAKIGAGKIRNYGERIEAAIAKNPAKYELGGFYLDNECGVARLVATNAYVLSIADVGEMFVDRGVILPKQVLSAMNAIVGFDEDIDTIDVIEYERNGKSIYKIKLGDFTIRTVNINGVYVDYRRIMDSSDDGAGDVTVHDAADMKKKVDKIGKFDDDAVIECEKENVIIKGSVEKVKARINADIRKCKKITVILKNLSSALKGVHDECDMTWGENGIITISNDEKAKTFVIGYIKN